MSQFPNGLPPAVVSPAMLQQQAPGATTTVAAQPSPVTTPSIPVVPAVPVAPVMAPVQSQPALPAVSPAVTPVPASAVPTPVATPTLPVATPPVPVVAPVAAPSASPAPVATPAAAGNASAPATPGAAGPTQAPVSQETLRQVALFHAAQYHQQQATLAAQNAAPPPPAYTQNQALQLFIALPPQQQRQVHANWIARQRIAAQNASQAGPPRPGSQAQVFHPSLLPNTSGAPGTPASNAAANRRPAPAAAPARQRPAKDPVKRLRVEVPDQRAQPSPLTAGYRTATAAADEHANDSGAAGRRRADDGLRGSMRGEIARLMYAAGDVVEPDVDSVDFVEDMVFEFLADFCRPIQPMRGGPNQAHQPVQLSHDVLRHRLASHSYLRKYLSRWDDMMYMSNEIQSSKRVTNPSHTDLIASVGKNFLGLDGEQDHGAGAKRRLVDAAQNVPDAKRRGRPPKNPEERKKPGPKKGWKKNLDPNAPVAPKKKGPTRPYKKRDRGSASVAPSPTKRDV